MVALVLIFSTVKQFLGQFVLFRSDAFSSRRDVRDIRDMFVGQESGESIGHRRHTRTRSADFRARHYNVADTFNRKYI